MPPGPRPAKTLTAPRLNDPTVSSLEAAYGQGNLLYDANSRIEWLDWGLTVALTYNDVVARTLEPSDPLFGFRHASRAELQGLYASAGLRGGDSYLAGSPEYAICQFLQFELGVNDDRGARYVSAGGYLGERLIHSPDIRYMGYVAISADDAVPSISAGVVIQDHQSDRLFGHALVRNVPVPEPSVNLLLFTGILTSVAVFALRRRLVGERRQQSSFKHTGA